MKNNYLCTLLITLPFHREMTNLSVLAAEEPPSDLARSDLEVRFRTPARPGQPVHMEALPEFLASISTRKGTLSEGTEQVA